MKYEDYNKKILEAVKKPDNLTEILQEVLDNIKVDCGTIAEQEEKINKLDEKVKTLNDMNTKLFMSHNMGSKEPEPEEEDGHETFMNFINEYVRKEN